MSEQRAVSPDGLSLASGAAIVLGGVVVVLAGGSGRSAIGGVGLNRLGQALFVAGFAFGCGYHYVLGHDFQAIGFGCVAAAWGLLFVDWLLLPLLGGAYFALLITLLVLGGALVVLGIFGDTERLREALPTERVLDR